MIFGHHLRDLRQQRGWSQERLAEAAGIDRTFLAEVETAKVSIALDRILRLADAFEVDPAALLEGLGR